MTNKENHFTWIKILTHFEKKDVQVKGDITTTTYEAHGIDFKIEKIFYSASGWERWNVLYDGKSVQVTAWNNINPPKPHTMVYYGDSFKSYKTIEEFLNSEFKFLKL